MQFSKALKIMTLTSLLTCGELLSQGENSPYLGAFSGFDVVFLNSYGKPTQIAMPDGIYQSIAINNQGAAIAGGISGGTASPIAFLISPTLQLTALPFPETKGRIDSVAINEAGNAIVGGVNTITNAPIAYLVSPSGVLTTITPLPSTNPIAGVGINSSDVAIIGGPNPPPAASLVSTAGAASPITLPFITLINDVSINFTGTSLIGGFTSGSPSAYLVSSSGTATPLPLNTSTGQITTVAINSNTTGIIGGGSVNGPPLLYLVSSSGEITPVAIPGGNGSVKSVAINENNNSIITGSTDSGLFAYFVSSTGSLTPISLPAGHQITSLNDVAINNQNVGLLVGGGLSALPIAFLVLPDGSLMGLPVVTQPYLSAAMILSATSQIPTDASGTSGVSLSGNNRIFANYINDNATEISYYFIPAVLTGTLPQALESAAPTRNAFAIFTADNNLFFLNSSLSRYSKNSRQNGNYHNTASPQYVAASFPWENEDCLLASNEDKLVYKSKDCIEEKERSYEVWGELIGAFAKQKAQHQTPAFQPTTGGLILAFDGRALAGKIGAGAAYSYTHIHEKKGMGHSNINQEYLFLYGMWQSSQFYADTALWAGYLQIENVRKIAMTGFNFESKSHPKAWQLAPHVEFGYDYTCNRVVMLEPYLMMDWVSNWQKHYKETGSGPFNTQQKDHYSSFLRSELGLRFYEVIDFNRWRLVLQEKAGYVNKKPFKVGRVTAALVGFPGSFTVETLTSPQNLGIAEMEFLFEFKNPKYPYGAIDYQGEFCSTYQSHQVSLGLGWNF